MTRAVKFELGRLAAGMVSLRRGWAQVGPLLFTWKDTRVAPLLFSERMKRTHRLGAWSFRVERRAAGAWRGAP